MVILPKAIYMFNAILIKIPMTFLTEIEKSVLNFIRMDKRVQIAKTILSKKRNMVFITIFYFKIYYRDIAIKRAWYWNKNKHENQWNGIEVSDMKPHSYTHLIFICFRQGCPRLMMAKRQPL
jgi:hypothetical protein